jgi:uncharacterized protein (DUF2147 family)
MDPPNGSDWRRRNYSESERHSTCWPLPSAALANEAIIRTVRSIVMLLIILASCVGLAAEIPNGTWLVNQRIAFDIFPCQDAACGKIVWLRNPLLRNLCGRVIIWGLTPDGASQWSGGWFYNPEDDKTYNLKADVENHDRISARIYQGIPLFGRTEILTRIESRSLAGWCAG